MSYIYRNRKGKKVYGWSCQIQIGDVGGRYPLGVNTKVEARKLQQQINALEYDSRFNPDRIIDNQRRFFDIIGRQDLWIKKQNIVKPKFFDVFDECVESKIANGVEGKATISCYKYTRIALLRTFKKNMYLSDMTQRKVDKYIHDLKKWGYGTVSTNQRIVLLRAVMSWTADRYEVQPIKWTLLKQEKHIPRFVYPHEFDKIIEVIENRRYGRSKLMAHHFKFYRLTGLRRAELYSCQLKANNFLRVYGKGGKERFIKLSEEALYHYQITRECMFTPHGLSQSWGKACKEVGIKARLHDLRHTFAFTQIAKDVNPYVLQGLMGHSNFKTTERYLKYDKNMFVDLVNNDEKLITSNETFLS